MLGNENLWETAAKCHELLKREQITHAICGGVAVCLHGYRRNTLDLDLIIRPSDAASVKKTLLDGGLAWDEQNKEFHSSSGIPVQFLMTGERAGAGSEVQLPEPEGEFNVEQIEGLPVLRLSKLIEIKIACASGSPRRTHKDLADVVELIAVRNLDSSFARYLHKSVRQTFRQLVRTTRDT
jgi:hypothetical protein